MVGTGIKFSAFSRKLTELILLSNFHLPRARHCYHCIFVRASVSQLPHLPDPQQSSWSRFTYWSN